MVLMIITNIYIIKKNARVQIRKKKRLLIFKMNKTLKRIQQKYDVSVDVWLMIERYLYENIYKDSLDWVTNQKLHKDIARISKNDSYTIRQRNYGRIMLHLLRPLKLYPHFCDIGPNHKKLLNLNFIYYVVIIVVYPSIALWLSCV